MPARHSMFIVLAIMAAISLSTRAQAQSQSEDKAQQIFNLTNQDRTDHGLQPLKWDASLATAATAHTERMANEKSLSHQYPGEPGVSDRAAQAGAHFQAIAENTAMGPSAPAIEKQWMNSTPHRTNILDPQMNEIGIAVVEKGGYLYATEDFANGAQSLTTQQVEDKVGALLHDQNIDPSGPRDQAEQACSNEHGMPQGSQAKAVIRFQTSDLTQLPSQIAQQLRSGQFTKAAVGACAPGQSEGNFTSYRVAVLLY
jgi:hypothetical protein